MGISSSSQRDMTTPTYHHPSPSDVCDVRKLLLYRLPRELADKVIDFAQYWPRVTASMDEEDEVHADGQVACSSVIVETDPLPDVTPSDWIDKPHFKMVRFVMDSHDQGWGGNSACRGTYIACWSWFEASILRREGDQFTETNVDGRKRFHVQNNVHVSHEYRQHEVVWTNDTLPDELGDDRAGRDGTGRGLGRGFVQALQPGDKVALIAIAQYPGWANHVRSAEIEVYYRV